MQPESPKIELILHTFFTPGNGSRAVLLFAGIQHKANKIHKSY